MEMARRLAGRPRAGFAATKQLLNRAAGVDRIDYHLDQELETLGRIANTPDFGRAWRRSSRNARRSSSRRLRAESRSDRMHEYSLMMALMERVAEEAAARRAIAVHRVRRLPSANSRAWSPSCSRARFAIVRAGTLCEGARARDRARGGALGVFGVPPSHGRRRAPAMRRVRRAAALAAGDEILLGQIELEVP